MPIYRVYAIYRRDADGRVLTPQEEGAEGAKLRSEIVAEMKRQKEIISLFVAQDWNSYIRRMSQSGTWGGQPPPLI